METYEHLYLQYASREISGSGREYVSCERARWDREVETKSTFAGYAVEACAPYKAITRA